MLRFASIVLFLFAAIGAARADVPPPYDPFSIGATLTEGQPFPTVSAVAANSPAASAGVKVGDGVIAINGVYAKGGAPFYFFARGLQGPKDSNVELIVLRANRDVLILRMSRSVPLR